MSEKYAVVTVGYSSPRKVPASTVPALIEEADRMVQRAIDEGMDKERAEKFYSLQILEMDE